MKDTTLNAAPDTCNHYCHNNSKLSTKAPVLTVEVVLCHAVSCSSVAVPCCAVLCAGHRTPLQTCWLEALPASLLHLPVTPWTPSGGECRYSNGSSLDDGRKGWEVMYGVVGGDATACAGAL
jgi:hypothetical protein